MKGLQGVNFDLSRKTPASMPKVPLQVGADHREIDPSCPTPRTVRRFSLPLVLR